METKLERLTRTDVHAPSRIKPEEYEFVAMEFVKIETLGDAEFLRLERERLRAHMARTGGTYSTHEHGGNCMVCGSVNAVYTVLFFHAPTNSYVRMGTDCAEKCEIGDPERFRRFRTAVEALRLARAGKLKAKGILAEAGLEAAWTLYEAPTAAGREEATVRDIVGKLVRYGSVSDKALGYVGALLGRIERRPAIEAARAAEREAAAPCPTGRVTVTGTVISTKWVSNGFRRSRWDPAETLKMLVKSDTGFKVFGTAPSALLGAELKGARVTFSAMVEPSKDDPKFGFFKRPTSAARLAAAPEAAPEAA